MVQVAVPHDGAGYDMRNHSLIVSSSRSRMMLMALPTLGPVLLLAICSLTCFTLPQALHTVENLQNS